MATEYFYTRKGQRHGPVSDEQLKELAATGQLGPEDGVWARGMVGWTPAGKAADLTLEFKEVNGAVAVAPAAAPAGLAPAAGFAPAASFDPPALALVQEYMKKPIVWIGLGAGALVMTILAVVLVIVLLSGDDKDSEGGGSYSSTAEITGTYKTEKGDTVTITKNGEVYQVRWEYSSTPEPWLGVGIRNGDMLSVGWDRARGGNLGISVFKIEKGDKGPKLVSEWAAYQDPKKSKETLLFDKKPDSSSSSNLPTPTPSGKPVTVTTAQLLQDFKQASVGNAKYKDKPIRVTGATMILVDDNESVVGLSNLSTFEKDGGMATIACRYKSSQRERVSKLQGGQAVTVTGRLVPERSEGIVTAFGNSVVIVLEDCTFE